MPENCRNRLEFGVFLWYNIYKAKNHERNVFMRTLYVLSKDDPPTLIGILSEITPGSKEPYGTRGEYNFEYKLSPSAPKTIMEMTYLPDRTKVYSGADVLEWLKFYFPSVNGKIFFDNLLTGTDLNEYDEWEWLKHFGKININTNVRLYEQLPEEAVQYDK
jgi:hypothetical protein